MHENKAVILLSRQPLRPSGKSLWVRRSAEAVHWLKERGAKLISSAGTQTWDLLTALASIERLPLILVIPAHGPNDLGTLAEQATTEFGLDPGLVTFLPVHAPEADKVDIMRERDRSALELADLILPVSLRNGSSLEQLMHEPSLAGRTVVDTFRAPYEKRTESLAYDLVAASLRPELENLSCNYLVHWTRSFHGPWPGERLVDYYRDIIASGTYPRTALDTLIRILTTRTIRPSRRHTPGTTACVSFSALSPVELVPLVKWRSRYREMAFEPYGLGIRRDLAEYLGILPVRYADTRHECDNTGETPWLRQSPGQITDWRREKEYRHLGDLDLSGISPASLLAFCCRPHEAARVESLTGVRTLSFLP